MDIHHFVGKKSHTETCWVYSQKGYEMLLRKNIENDSIKPGLPVAEFYQKSCPMWWTHNGWVEEAEGQLSLF